MCETNFMHGWVSLVGSLATIAIILTAMALMLGLVKPADAMKHGGVIVGIATVLVLIVSVFVGFWSSMSLWQRAVLAAIGFGVWRLRQERRQPRKNKEDEGA
jgi:hypothetical protein